MKISIINKLVIGALVATIVTGCGGSAGTTPVTSGFTGIFVPTRSGMSVKAVSNMNGSGETEINMPSSYQPTSVGFDSNGKLYVGVSQGTVVKVDNPGGHPGELTIPSGKVLGVVTDIAFDSAGNLYMNDGSNRKIVRVSDMSGAGWTEMEYSAQMFDEKFIQDSNTSLAIDSQNRIYIGSQRSGKIYRFNMMGDWTPAQFGAQGAGVNQFSGINDLFIDEQDRIYVADRSNCRIVRINDMMGGGWTSFGTFGTGIGQFSNPDSVSVDKSGKVYIVDRQNGRLVRIDGMSGGGWTTFGSLGSGVGQFPAMDDILVR